VGRRRQENIEEKNVEAVGVAVNTPIIEQGLNNAMALLLQLHGDGDGLADS